MYWQKLVFAPRMVVGERHEAGSTAAPRAKSGCVGHVLTVWPSVRQQRVMVACRDRRFSPSHRRAPADGLFSLFLRFHADRRPPPRAARRGAARLTMTLAASRPTSSEGLTRVLYPAVAAYPFLVPLLQACSFLPGAASIGFPGGASAVLPAACFLVSLPLSRP